MVSLPSPRRQERDYGGPINIGLVAFEKNVQLWLNPLDGILAGYDTPVYHAYVDHTLSGNVRFDKLKDVSDLDSGSLIHQKRNPNASHEQFLN